MITYENKIIWDTFKMLPGTIYNDPDLDVPRCSSPAPTRPAMVSLPHCCPFFHYAQQQYGSRSTATAVAVGQVSVVYPSTSTLSDNRDVYS